MSVVFWLVVLVLLTAGVIQGIREWQHERWVKSQVRNLDDEIEGLNDAK